MTYLHLLAQAHDNGIHIPVEWFGVAVGTLCSVIAVLYRGKAAVEKRERNLLRRLGGIEAVETTDED